MAKYFVLALTALSLAGCYTTPAHDSSAAAGGSAAPAPGHVRVQLDSGPIQDFPTDYSLRGGDRVIVLANGKVAPL